MDAPRPLGIRTEPRYRVADEASVVAMLVMYGWTIDVRQGRAAEAGREAAATLERWIAMGLAYERAPDGARRFDIAEVLNFARGPARHRGDRGYERIVRQARAFALAFHPAGASADAPPRPDTLPPRRFTVTLLREFAIPPTTPGGKLLFRLPMPIEDETLGDVLFDVIAPPGSSPDVAIAPGRLDVRLPAPDAPSLVVGARWSFTCDPSRAARGGERLDDDERDLYTRPAEGILKLTPRIAALADGIAGAEREPFAVVRRFVDHLVDRLHLGVVHYDELDPAAPTDWVLDSGWFDCQMGSALVAAMCRARGIPARLVSGLQLTAAPAGHYWLEAWIDRRGWTPFDLNVCDLSARGRDAAWRGYYAGALDYRMKTQVLPRVFNLTPSIRFPKAWHVLASLTADGTRSITRDDATGALVYDDRVSVARDDAPPGAFSVNATPS